VEHGRCSGSTSTDYRVTLVLITGCTGFVGRQVLRRLAELDVEVRLVRRATDSLKISGVHIESEVRTPDLFVEDAGWWARVSSGVDTAIHLAWYAEPGNYQQSPRNIDCARGTLAMAQGFIAAGGRRFIGIGSCAEYEMGQGNLSIETPLRPATPYAGAKAATYMALSPWLRNEKVDFLWCRLFYMYGEGEDVRRLVPYLRSRLSTGQPAELTAGTQVRDFLDVCDAGAAIADVALGDATGAYNVCSGIPLTVRELAERIADEYGRRDLLKFGVRPENVFDPPRVVGIPGQSI
jgi:nucleoside-diphosphate-sugar epimerase